MTTFPEKPLIKKLKLTIDGKSTQQICDWLADNLGWRYVGVVEAYYNNHITMAVDENGNCITIAAGLNSSTADAPVSIIRIQLVHNGNYIDLIKCETGSSWVFVPLQQAGTYLIIVESNGVYTNDMMVIDNTVSGKKVCIALESQKLNGDEAKSYPCISMTPAGMTDMSMSQLTRRSSTENGFVLLPMPLPNCDICQNVYYIPYDSYPKDGTESMVLQKDGACFVAVLYESFSASAVKII